MNARQSILDKLYQTRDLADFIPTKAESPELPTWDDQQKLEKFTQMISAVNGEVHLCNKKNWPSKLLEIAQQKKLGNLLHAPQTQWGAALAAHCQAIGHQLELLEYPQSIDEEGFKEKLFFNIDAGFTGSIGAIAETGTLIVWPDQHEPRLMSLVPPVHFCMLEKDKIWNTFAELIENAGWQKGLPNNALLISGPSKTADIEQTLAYGAHGPSQLIVLVV